MSLFSKLFGGGSKPSQELEPERYKEFAIFPEPISEGGQWRVAARIVRDVDGETRTHQLIRADVLSDRQAAADASVGKAKALIDERGDRLLDDPGAG